MKNSACQSFGCCKRAGVDFSSETAMFGSQIKILFLLTLIAQSPFLFPLFFWWDARRKSLQSRVICVFCPMYNFCFVVISI